jgi:RNA polymerase sigma-70 factor (ECF subfamily)
VYRTLAYPARDFAAKGKIMSDFGSLLEMQIPRMRRYALSLTRDRTRADDLVQNCLVRALWKSHLWQPGTNLRAWLFTLIHNQHVNDIRNAIREGTKIPIESLIAPLTTPATQTTTLDFRDLRRALRCLPPSQAQALLLIGDGMGYDEVASTLKIPVGTVRSRVSRGRVLLRELMETNTFLPVHVMPKAAIRVPTLPYQADRAA